MVHDEQDAHGVPSSHESGSPPSPALPLSPAVLAHEIGDLIIEKKGLDLTVIEVEKVTSITDYVVIATASSARQVQSMAGDILAYAKRNEKRVLSQEGQEQGWWVLIDFGDAIVHLMQEDARQYYDLEMIWGDGDVVRRCPVEDFDGTGVTLPLGVD